MSPDFICSRRKSFMKVNIKHWHAVAHWRWDTGHPEGDDDPDGEGDVCGICRVPFEGCCPSCKVPGDDCPLSCVLPCSLLQHRDLILAFSLGRVHPCFPYALSPKMDWHLLIETAMSDGQANMGCVDILLFVIFAADDDSSYCRAKSWQLDEPSFSP